MTPVELDFVIIGAQKSASTFVHHCLARHPQIDLPGEETRTFEDPYYLRGSTAELDGLFGPRDPAIRRGIKRPDYLADPLVPERIATAAPLAGMIVVLRDPVDRAVSAYFHYIRLGFLPNQPFERGFEQILDGTLERSHPRAADVIDYGRYGEHLERYLRHFDRSQLHVVLQPDLRRDPGPAMAGVLDFLGVDAASARALVAQTPAANESTYDHRRIRLQSSRNRHLFVYDADRYRRQPRRVTPWGYLAAGAATVLDTRVLARFDQRRAPGLPSGLADRLRDEYASDTERLRALVGPLPWADTAVPPPTG